MISQLFLIAIILLTSLMSISAPSCNYVQSNIETKLILGDRIIIDSYKCKIENYNASDEPETKKATVFAIGGRQIPIEASNSYTGIELLETHNLPSIRALKFSRPGASNVGNSIRVFDDKWNHLTTINNPANKYQVTNRRGSEYDVVGFFKSGDDWYIEDIRSLGGDCNACMQYIIDTYKVTNSTELVVIDSRDFDITDYERDNKFR